MSSAIPVARERLLGLLPGRADWAAVHRSPRRDLLAGLTVAVVALPLALAFGVTSGLGAQAGLITAVIAGAVAAVFGGSNLQVSGPTGAMTVVLVPVVQQFGATGVLMVGAMAGLVLIALAVARLGRYVRYLPTPVLEGFTAGIAVVIALQQVPAALGVSDAHGEKVWAVAFDAVARFVVHPRPAALAVALAVAALMLLGARWRPGLPFSLLGVGAATVLAEVIPVDLIRIGALPQGLPAPSLSFLDLGALGVLLPSALAVAALAALESLLSATVADGMTVGERHDPDRELFGQGMANLAAPSSAVSQRPPPSPGRLSTSAPGRPRSWRPSPTPSPSRPSCWPPRRWSAGSRSPPWPGCCWPPPSAWWRLVRCGRWPGPPGVTPSCWYSPSPSR